MNAQPLLRYLRNDPSRGADNPAKHELLLHDVYEMPAGPDEETILFTATGQVLCTACGQTGESEESVHHESWCLYVNGPICLACAS